MSRREPSMWLFWLWLGWIGAVVVGTITGLGYVVWPIVKVLLS